MAFEERIDSRLRELIAGWNLERKTMFGGTAYMLSGNMVCGVNKDLVILRVNADTAAELLTDPRISHFDMTGRPMTGWLQVASGDVDDETLMSFLETCRAHVASLPPKDPTKKRRMGRK